MKRQNPNRISELRLAKQWNQQELAEAVGAHKITISKLERGDIRLTQSWLERLAAALNVHPAEILADAPLVRSIYINGSIANKVDLLGEGDFKFYSPRTELESVRFEVDIGSPGSRESLHFFAETELFGPIVQSGDILRFVEIGATSEELERALGRLCIFETDKPKAMLIGTAERGKGEGEFDLRLPRGGYRRGIRPERIFVLNMVLGLPAVLVNELGEPV